MLVVMLMLLGMTNEWVVVERWVCAFCNCMRALFSYFLDFCNVTA